ncbi:hypothetical protein ACFV29_38555 [Streptomyces sp. NPDC059690]|uniref:hypothetical protein n=1 Tax=Streptomyces sp. NPDC059690 TaxID=3346907 RepID=UPI0036D0457F
MDYEEIGAASALKRRLDSSLTAQAVLAFLLALSVTALFSRPDEHPTSRLLRSVLHAGMGVVFMVVQRRRIGRAAGTDASRLADLNRKIRHREVPTDPGERAAMRRLVAKHLRPVERGRRWLPYWMGLMGLIAVGVLVLGAATDSLQSALQEQDERVS